MKKVLIIFGTRPEAIKFASVIHELGKIGMNTVIAFSNQHKDLVPPLMDFFSIKINYRNSVSEPTTEQIYTFAIEVISSENPSLLLVQGDTRTAYIAAKAGHSQGIPIGHVEAGLRTNNLLSPFPEELYRQMISKMATIHFCPTETTLSNLKKEGITEQAFVTGNTVIDAVDFCLKENKKKTAKEDEFILFTLHRYENESQIDEIIKAVFDFSTTEKIKVIFPMHPKLSNKDIPQSEWFEIMDPLFYPEFIHKLKNCLFIVSDSGGVQEEATYLGKRVGILRNETERPEAISKGLNSILGTSYDQVIEGMKRLMNKVRKEVKLERSEIYGKGTSGKRIAEKCLHWVDNFRDER